MEALKPCPFCGGEAELERAGDRRQSTIYACLHCSCRLETGEEWGYGADWNTRSSDPRIAELEARIAYLGNRLRDETALVDTQLTELARLRAAGTFNEGIEEAAGMADDIAAGVSAEAATAWLTFSFGLRSLLRPEGGA